MKKQIEKLVLETINNSGSVMPLFKTGYAYSQVLSWCEELEDAGMISWNKDEVRYLTAAGINRLLEIKKRPEKTMLLIKPLSQFKCEKIGIEDVFLP